MDAKKILAAIAALAPMQDKHPTGYDDTPMGIVDPSA